MRAGTCRTQSAKRSKQGKVWNLKRPPAVSGLERRGLQHIGNDAAQAALEALEGLTEEGTDVAETTCVYLQNNGKYTVTDNGEKVTDLDRKNAIRVMVENLIQS